ncbi:MAG: type III pantothenate kinase [Bacteroidales bacterium]|nr:type III pantothenate kinase [Bacteroidales bacterium]
MNLVIDYGNTLKKIALYDRQNMVYFKPFRELDATILCHHLPEKEQIRAAILASTGNCPQELIQWLNSSYRFIELTEQVPVPITNRYETPLTLGKDRLAAVVAAQERFPRQDILAVSAGTCITYDFINASKEYLGGSISPGIHMRFKALHTFTAHLPLIEMAPPPRLTGENTEESILSGVMNGIVAEMNGIIHQYRQEYPDIKIILSGGDANYFEKRLKNNIFAIPNIVLEGLNLILSFNLGEKHSIRPAAVDPD